jgi:hypothetical protein
MTESITGLRDTHLLPKCVEKLRPEERVPSLQNSDFSKMANERYLKHVLVQRYRLSKIVSFCAYGECCYECCLFDRKQDPYHPI